MVNAKSMRTIIKKTLKDMTAYKHVTDSDVNLIEITFLEQSDMEAFVQGDAVERHGLMAWDFKRFETFLNEVVKINTRFAEDINNIALIDVMSDTTEDIWEACSYNIALQVLLTYQFYRHTLSEMPVGADEVVAVYLKHWPNVSSSRSSKTIAKRLAAWSNEINRGRFVA